MAAGASVECGRRVRAGESARWLERRHGMDISTMAGMLLEGFGVSAQVFALTLLGSIPLEFRGAGAFVAL